MAVSKVDLANGQTLIDLTNDTVTAETLAEGITAHGADGEPIVGTMRSSEDLNSVLTEQEELIVELQETLRRKAAGSGGAEVELSLITRQITEYSNPELTNIGDYAFSGCKSLTSISLPAMEKMGAYSFMNCSALTRVVFPALSEVPNNGFRESPSIEYADFLSITKIGSNGFYKCNALNTLILRSSTVCTIASGTVFTNAPIALGTGYIYVPAALIDSYKAATNWAAYSAQFRAIEDYPEICGGEA